MKPSINYKKTILLIDDDEDDCFLLCQALAVISDGISLSCTQNTDQLLETIECNKPSLIFIDLHLPKKSGFDCLKQIKSHLDFKDIPVIIWSTSSVTRNAIGADAQELPLFFQKPSCYKELIKELRTILLQNGIEFKQSQFPVQ
jgi:DNA-binding NtrC family response regulator